MSVRTGLFCTLMVTLAGLLVLGIGCGAMKDWDYFADVKGSGLSTGQTTDVPSIMQQMRQANLKLVDSLIYQHAQNARGNAMRMYELALALQQAQPAVAIQSSDDAAKFKKLADDLAQIIVEVGAAAQDNRMDVADWHYAQAFPSCNPLTIPEVEQQPEPATGAETPATGAEVAPVPDVTAPE